MNNNEEKILIQEDLENVAGGGVIPKGQLAKVFSLDGGEVKMYETTYDGFGHFWTVPNGSEMKVDTVVNQYPDDGPKKCAPFRWANYNRKWLKIKEEEVMIEWLQTEPFKKRNEDNKMSEKKNAENVKKTEGLEFQQLTKPSFFHVFRTKVLFISKNKHF